MPAPPKVSRGQAITQAQMDALAERAREKLDGKPYTFPQPVWQVQDRASLLRFDLADWGVDPGGIVVVKEERKVYQLRPFLHTQAGLRSWEIFENWELKTNWRMVDGTAMDIFNNPPYHDKLRLEAGVGFGHFAIIVAPWGRNGSFPPLGGLHAPLVYQYVGPGGPNELASWRLLGGAQEGYYNLGTGGQSNVAPNGTPIWRTELRAIQRDAIAKISNASGLPWRDYLYGQRQLSYQGEVTGGEVTGRRDLFVTRQGAPMPFDASLNLPTLNTVRIYKNIDYYARSVSEVEVTVYCSHRGIYNQFANQFSGTGNFLNPPFGLPSGVDLNFRILNSDFTPPTSRTLWGIFSPNAVGSPIDTTGVGVAMGYPVFAILWGDHTGEILSDLFSQGQFSNALFDQITGINYKQGVSWNGGQCRLSTTNNNVAVGAHFHLVWRWRIPVNQVAFRSGHKTSPGNVYRARMPDIVVEVNGYPTPVSAAGETSLMHIQQVTMRPVSGDLLGAWVATPIASAPIVHNLAANTPGDLKYPFSTFNMDIGTTADEHLRTWTLVPYPVLPRPGSGVIPAATAAQKWKLGADIPGNATLYDVTVTRVSPVAGRLDYTGTPSLTVTIGCRVGTSFKGLFTVTIPAGQGIGRATAADLRDVVIMDNEPLYYASPNQSTVSMVQVLALARRAGPAALGSVGNLNGAQFGFSESYNETVDLLESIP